MKQLVLKLVNSLNLYSWFNRYTRNTGTIFMLHAVVPEDDPDPTALRPSALRQMFDYLKENDYTVLSLAEYVTRIIENKDTYKTVVFTVDDGYRNFYLNAFEIFKQHGYPATVFITSDFIEKKLFFWWDTVEFTVESTRHTEIDLGFMGEGKVALPDQSARKKIADKVVRYCKTLTNVDKLALIERLVTDLEVDISGQPAGKYEPLSWDEIRLMRGHRIDFHPHTKTHPIMARLTREKKIEEVTLSRQKIEERIGAIANIFCYPNGQWDDFDEETIEALKDAGYIAAVTGIGGFDDTKSDVDLFRLRRFGIPVEMVNFKQYVSGLEHFKYRVLG